VIVSPRSRACSIPAAIVALVSMLLLGAAGAPDTADAAEQAARGKDGSRGKARAACVKRVSRNRGVSRRAAKRICRHTKRRRPAGSAVPEGNSGVASAETPAAAQAPAAAAAAGARAVPAAATGCANADAAPSAANVAAIRAAVLCLVNAQRAASGLGALVDNAVLTAAAQGHSDEMVARRYFAHTSADGGDFGARLAAAGWTGATSGENIAWGGGALGTPAQIVASWMNSPGHKANILNGAFTNSGVGVAPVTPSGGGGGTYTHDFGG
jgi:uncharacterized protein YkwD